MTRDDTTTASPLVPHAATTAVTLWLTRLGDASYALYLCHPFAIRLVRLGWEATGWQGPLSLALFVCVAVTAAALAAWPIHWLFEVPVTRVMRGALSRQGTP